MNFDMSISRDNGKFTRKEMSKLFSWDYLTKLDIGTEALI